MRPRRAPYGLMKLARARGWRQAIASLTLVLFAFQSYLTQSHVHLLRQDAPAASIQATDPGAVPARDRGKLPPAGDPATCPICLDMVLAGHFTAPGIFVLPMPAQIATTIAAAIAIPAFVAAVSHIWRGRAPPQH